MVAEFVPGERVAWYSMHMDGSGVRSYHTRLLIPVADGGKLIAESMEHGREHFLGGRCHPPEASLPIEPNKIGF
jgi:hypothetical protein